MKRGATLKPIFLLITAPLMAVTLPACTSQQLSEATYNSIQGHQREECYKTPPGSDRDRCISQNGTTYDQYKRDSGAGKQ
jgi:hypothetical protein